ncbi:Ribophorin I [Corchorus olitorius]|uniref:Dolichyl-diphosphooligosaccharide--protein glycosyltransferase subunit 1 n=1 Tax=Corchorus olitorius TaxID=93759 RepID=A0A1R3FYR3_9ROSI|nr:Ribophorin I [Corchorus olitorius]
MFLNCPDPYCISELPGNALLMCTCCSVTVLFPFFLTNVANVKFLNLIALIFRAFLIHLVANNEEKQEPSQKRKTLLIRTLDCQENDSMYYARQKELQIKRWAKYSVPESCKHVENTGPEMVSEVLLAFPELQAKNLAFLMATPHDGKGKVKNIVVSLPNEAANLKDVPPALAFYSVSLPKGLAEAVVFQESAYYLSPYAVKVQSLSVKLPDSDIESFTKLEKTTHQGSEIKYGIYENLPAYLYSPIVVHFPSNQPFAVAKELVREIEISHWGNVQVTEHYKLIHGGAQSKGEFSRLDFQARLNVKGASAFSYLVANLPPRAHSVYYWDEIGNISTSHLWTELLIEPRYPMFGGWRTAFTIGYGLPLQDFLYESEGKRFLSITFSTPVVELVIDTLIVKGSRDISVSAPFPVKQWQETKISHLDIDGRPVVVLEKNNVVPEHNQYFQISRSDACFFFFFFQVYYKFNKLSMLREPLMLISGFFFLFVACIVYMHADISISKSSASYLAKEQWEELEASLRDLSRTGDVQACKAARKAADGLLKELSKELKPLLTILQSSPSAALILPKVEELVAKEKELQEKMMLKHSTVVDGYEKKFGARDIEN